jgi:hypothetical protein
MEVVVFTKALHSKVVLSTHGEVSSPLYNSSKRVVFCRLFTETILQEGSMAVVVFTKTLHSTVVLRINREVANT